ncbi:MAG: DNA-processing protein DprA, partial [Gammaproteobacteria bacterium]|nr:DNA-processing protein DprA [Gammaproteobacteria bacterium]
VIFGGAGDIDGIAMTAALDAGGIAIGVLAGNLLKKSLARDARNAISSNRLLLVSPYHPNARFTIQSAMKRNRLIYALADYGLVVSAEYKKGGTWIGAMEELTRDNALGIFVRTGANIPLGNRKLLDSGAREWPGIESLFGSRTSKNPEAVKKSPDLGVCPGYGDRSEKV